MRILLCIVTALLTFTPVSCLNNGLALTPPMGWNSWQRFRCNTDCDVDPTNCITETLFMQMADHLVAEGYKDLGYEYINMDDCWMSDKRNADGTLQPDPKRFPNGPKKLADYIHSLGLKFGLYQDMGTETCDGYPGIVGHLQIDAKTYAEWGVDYVKMDGCHNLGRENFEQGFREMSGFLNKTGHPFIFSCEWGFDMRRYHPNYTEIGVYCNTMRQYNDVQDSWQQVLSILDWYTLEQEVMSKVNGPGKFIDMDFLIIGGFSLSYTQAQSQMALWSIMSSQLLMGNDLRKMDPKMKAILQNSEVIAINQDKLGKMGMMIRRVGTFQVWTKVLDQGCFAAVIFSRATDMPHNYTTSLHDLAFPEPLYLLRDVINHRDMGVFDQTDKLEVKVNPGGVVMFKATPIKMSFKVY